jgi:hypothetical protein
MATAYSKRDVNRFSKTYRYVRQQPRYEYQIDETVIDETIADKDSIEVKRLSLEGGGSVTFSFDKVYSSTPLVFTTGEDGASSHVESKDTASALIGSSAEGTSAIHVHVISSDAGDGEDLVIEDVSFKRDTTRFSKNYAYLRKSVKNYYRLPVEDAGSVYINPPNNERSTVSFAGSDTVTYTFSRSYTVTPHVIVTPLDSLNVWVETTSTTQVVIRSSTECNSTVDIEVIEVLSATDELLPEDLP